MNDIYRRAVSGLAGPAIVLFVTLALLYTFSAGLRASRSASITGDEPFYLVTTQSLLDDGDLDLRNQYEYETYRSFFDHPDRLWRQAGPLPDGRLLSPHQPGLAVLVLPGFALGGLRGVHVELLLIAALTFSLAFVVAALETGRRGMAWFAAAVTGLSAPAFVYSTEVYPEMPAALCVVVALLALRMRPGLFRALCLTVIISGLAWLGLKYVPLGMVIAGFWAWRAGRDERVALLLLGSASAAVYVWWHVATFGALTPYNSNLVYDGASTASVLESHVSFGDRIYRIWGLFIDRRFGIGRWAPVFLAIIPALPLVWRAIPSGRLVTILCATQILVATFVAVTMMGWWFPGRMLIAVFPLFAVVLAVGLARIPAQARVLAVGAGMYSLVVTALLVRAAEDGSVAIAVNPFDIDAAPFAWAGRIFPLYTWWTGETVVLNAAWLAMLIGATVATACWPFRRRVLRIVSMGAPAGLRAWRTPAAALAPPVVGGEQHGR